jgi:hypothetical protein
MASPEEEEAKLERFLQWLQVNGVELRGCKIKYCDSKSNKGFGIFSANEASDGNSHCPITLSFLAEEM